jgi:transcriptional regulator with XRE-family HTH domain
VAFGTRLRALRRQRFLTQEDLADHCRLSRTTIRRLEAGAVRPRVHTVTALAAGLHVDAAELVPDPAQFWAEETTP